MRQSSPATIYHSRTLDALAAANYVVSSAQWRNLSITLSALSAACSILRSSSGLYACYPCVVSSFPSPETRMDLSNSYPEPLAKRYYQLM